MLRRFTKPISLTGLSLLYVLTLALPILRIAQASADTGWGSGAPQIQKIADMSQADVDAIPSAGACTPMTLPVVHIAFQQVLTNNESHCMVRTSEGLLDGYATLFQQNGFDKAYPMNSFQGGHPVTVPIPNYPGALQITGDPAYPGVDVGLYKMLTSHTSFNPLSLTYTLTGPDLYFKYPSGRQMAFVSVGSFSNGGTYWVAEADGFGFVRVNLTTLQMTTFAANTQVNSAGNPLGAESEISPSGKYAAVAYNAPGGWGSPYFKMVDVNSCGDATAAYSSSSTCQTQNYWSQLQQAIPGLTSIGDVSFANDNSLNFVATIGSGSSRQYANYSMTAAGSQMRLEQYLGLGDSFASGEGTFNYTTGTETSDDHCHQSIDSYPYLMSAQVGTSASVACSGAVMGNVFTGLTSGGKANQLQGDVADSDITQQQISQALGTHLPGYVAQDTFLPQDLPQAVTVSVGGNNIGFQDIVERCVQSSGASGSCYSTYEDRLEVLNQIDDQFNNLVNTYKDLKQGDPSRRVYVIGYPQIMSATGSCGDDVFFNQDERNFAVQLTQYLDSVIQKAAQNAGVFYVDTQNALSGSELCQSGLRAVNGLTLGNDIHHVGGSESYHPNVYGQQLLANAIEAGTHNLTSAMPAADSSATISAPSSTLPILQVPHTGRIVNQVLDSPDDPAQALITRGDTTTENVDDYQSVLAPNSTVSVTIHSDPINLGTTQTDSTGQIHAQITIPNDLEPGIHTLHFYGKNLAGDPVDIQRNIYVAASGNDYDGDGVPNVTDSCPNAPNSGQDINGNGIDDACDPAINTAAPVVMVTNPAAGVPLSGTVPINARVFSGLGYSQMLYVFNSSSQSVVAQYKYGVSAKQTQMTYNWDTTKVPNGNYTINFSAKDSANNKNAGSTYTVKVTVNN